MSQTKTEGPEPFVIHPVARYFPDLPDDEFAELKADIEVRGLAEPILKKGNVVLDGRHRLRACQELGIEPRFLEFKGDDEAAEIASRNIFRRHLTNDQRVAIMAKVLGPKLANEAEARMKAGDLRVKSTQGSGRSHELLAREAGVSQHKARQAMHLTRHAGELVEMVVTGQATLRSAAKQAKASRPMTKARLKNERTLQEVVQIRFQAFMNHFPMTQHRMVKEILRQII